MSDINKTGGLWDKENSLGPLVRTESSDSYYEKLIMFWRLLQIGSVEQVRSEIAKGIDVNEIDPMTGATALMVATAYSSPEIVQCLIDAGALINVRSRCADITRLFRDIEKDHLHVIKEWQKRNREEGPPRIKQDGLEATSLELALKRGGCPEIVEALLAWGADVHTKDGNGDSPLFMAIDQQDIKSIKLLLDHGARVNDRDQAGETPLMRSAKKRGNLEIVQLLLEAGAQVNAVDPSGATAFMWAARKHAGTYMLEALVRSGSTVEFHDTHGFTPLLYTIASRYSGEVELMIRCGANPKAVTQSGQTALMLLFEADDNEDHWPYPSEELEICDRLLKKGVDINAQDNKGKTALMYAICSCHPYKSVLNTLFAASPDLSLKDVDGRTARDYLLANEELMNRDALQCIYEAMSE
jgi:uncharacterized protein